MIRTVTPSAATRSSVRRRRATWHKAFVIRRRFYCQRRRTTVLVWFETIERRRLNGSWHYRTLA